MCHDIWRYKEEQILYIDMVMQTKEIKSIMYASIYEYTYSIVV